MSKKRKTKYFYSTLALANEVFFDIDQFLRFPAFEQPIIMHEFDVLVLVEILAPRLAAGDHVGDLIVHVFADPPTR